MEIKFLGHSSFKIRGKKATVVTDPFSKEIGFSMPKTKADIVTISHSHKDHSDLSRIKGEPFVISGPGEYEVKGVSILGISSFHDSSSGSQRGKNTIYLYLMDDLKISHLGDLGHKLSEKQLEEINGVDILMIPVGGVYTIGPREAVEVISQVEPKIIIPMHYQTPKLSFELKEVGEFLEEMGIEELKPLEKLKVTSSSLPEEREVVVLKEK